MKISELSKATGVSQRMIRYFEQMGLLSPGRTEADYRVYTPVEQNRITEIREWQRLGLTLKEIRDILQEPTEADAIIEKVFIREREFYLEKQKSLQDLRERVTKKKYQYFENRVAYTIPGMDQVLNELGPLGWKNTEFSYLRFGEWHESVAAEDLLIGEIIWQSSFYLLASPQPQAELTLERLIKDFCRTANRIWPVFDGHPPQKIENEDIGEFFAPNDIVVSLTFEEPKGESLKILLPYQAVFAVAKVSAEKRAAKQ